MRYPLAQDTIDAQDIRRLIRWLEGAPHLTQGPVTREFESVWSQWLGRRYSLFCNSGSSANLLMYQALALSGRLHNRKVVVPAVGWATTLAPALQLGFEPLLCEADPETFGLDLNHLEALLRRHEPSTVVLVQVLGVPHKMEALLALKARYGFILLEDACAAVGSTWRGQRVGTFGDLASFSFYFGHQISTIEGGMVSTDDHEWIELLRMLRSHGWSRDLDPETHQGLVTRYEIDDFHRPFVFYVPGYNLRSTDLNAWIGLGQMERIEWVSWRRHENHQRYCQHLADRFTVQQFEEGSRIASISFGVVARDSDERKQIVSALREEGVETRLFSAGNLGLHPFWYERFGKPHFPMADRIHFGGFFLPNHPHLTLEDVDRIAGIVLDAVAAKV